MSERNIKLAILTDTLAPWTNGGRESRFSELLPLLARDGIDITVYTMRWWESPPPTQHIGSGSIRLKAISGPRPLYENGRRSFLHAIVFSLTSFRLLFEDFDVLETDSIPFFHLPVVWIVSKIRRRPLVVVWHEFWGRSYWAEYLGKLGTLGYWFERASTRVGDIEIAVSRRTFRQLSNSGKDNQRLIFVENAVRRLPFVADSSSPEIVFVGRLIEHKRPDLAISALAELSDTTVRMIIVGSGPMKIQLMKQAALLELKDQITFVDSVNDDTLGRLLYNARFLVSPSEREGFGLVVAEALSLGTPVITVDAPSNAAIDFVIDGVSGRICPNDNAARLAVAMRELLANPPERGDVILSWESLGIPESFEATASALREIYERLVVAY